MTDDDIDWDQFEKMVKRMRSQIERGEGYDVDQLLTRAWVDMGRVIPDFSSAAQGLLDAQRGIPAARYDSSRSGGFQLDDGLEIDDPDGPDILPPPDAAVAVRKELFRSAMDAVKAITRMRDLVIVNARMGLPRDDPRRKATTEESKASEGESIDDEHLCISCARLAGQNLRVGGSKLCGWCRGIVVEYGPPCEGKAPGNGPRWPQMAMPPIELVHDHLESQQGRQKLTTREVERRLRLCFGTPRRAA